MLDDTLVSDDDEETTTLDDTLARQSRPEFLINVAFQALAVPRRKVFQRRVRSYNGRIGAGKLYVASC